MLTVEALESTNPLLLATLPRIDALGNLFFDISTGHKGQARFSVKIADDGSSAGPTEGTVARGAPYVGRPAFSKAFSIPAAHEFAICVVKVNQQPTFSTLNVSAPSGTYERQRRVVFAVNVSAGPGDVGQTLSWRYSYDNALIFVHVPVLTVQHNWIVGSTMMMVGIMDVEIKSNVYGHSDFTVILSDDGVGNAQRGDINTSIAQTFRLTVTSPNYEPSFELVVGEINVLEGSGEQYFENAIRSARAGPQSEAWQELAFSLHNVTAVQTMWPPAKLFNSFQIIPYHSPATGTICVSRQDSRQGKCASNHSVCHCYPAHQCDQSTCLLLLLLLLLFIYAS